MADKTTKEDRNQLRANALRRNLKRRSYQRREREAPIVLEEPNSNQPTESN